MHPIFLKLGGLEIRWYGVMAALGFLSAYFIIYLNRKRAGMNSDQVASLLFVSIICGIGGARIFYVIRFWNQFRGNLLEIFRIDHGGLVFYGGFFLVIAALFIFCHKNKLNLPAVLDIIAPGLAIGHAFGRIGCFLNGCCYGKPTQCFLGVTYPENSAPGQHYHELTLHPVQLYEATANVVFFLILLFMMKRVKRGQLMSIYIFGYGTLRFCDEFFRGDHTNLWFGTLTQAQVTGLILIPIGIILFMYFQRKNDTNKDIQTDS